MLQGGERSLPAPSTNGRVSCLGATQLVRNTLHCTPVAPSLLYNGRSSLLYAHLTSGGEAGGGGYSPPRVEEDDRRCRGEVEADTTGLERDQHHGHALVRREGLWLTKHTCIFPVVILLA